ncbi:hypothetical protein ACJRO7_007183 [Eucalyptus globulus]|uniref:HMA domain-containing protein n=1 Tax=Eucalyptus globulus TaxID=34317 RepID=A0ABD3IL89_EUCGL
MKRKLVIKVSMNGHASRFCCFGPQNPRSKALKVAGGFQGVQSVALTGDQDRIEVTGDLDAVNLTTLLRKKVGFAEIVSVSEDKNEADDNPGEIEPIMYMSPYPREVVYLRDPYSESWCWPL